jgi:arylsulfatase A-like enzyme
MSATPTAAKLSLLVRLGSLGIVALALVLAARSMPRAWSPLGSVPITANSDVPPPNVLLVTLGSLRPDHLGSYGYGWETSPTIDALASEGVRFRTVVAPSSFSLTSYATLFTSRPPEDHGVLHPTDRLDSIFVTLPEVYAHAGYATAAFVASPLLASRFGFDQGFETYDEGSAAHLAWNAVPTGFGSAVLIERASRWLRSWAREEPRRPFFLFVNLWDVHPEFAAQKPDEPGGDLDPTALQRRVELYDQSLRHADAQLGRLIHLLGQLGVLDDTIVAVTSDRGEELLDHGGLGAGRTLFDEAILVPLVIRYPRRVQGGRVMPSQARLADVAPTLLSLSRILRPAEFGAGAGALFREQSFAPWLGAVPAAEALPQLTAVASTALVDPPLEAVRSETAKVIVAGGVRVGRQVYDLKADPGERHDLAPTNRQAGAELVAVFAQWQTYWESRREMSRRMQRQR